MTNSQELLKSTFSCPSCNKGSLNQSGKTIVCSSCQSEFNEANGIYYFNKDKARFYWGVHQRAMDNMLYYSDKDGQWEDAMHEMIDSLPIKEGNLMWARSFDPSRSTLQSILDIKKTDRVLEVGPGWGAIALHIAPNCKEYFALDQIPNHVRYIQKIKQYDQENTKNIHLICSGNDNHLPFQDQLFDCIILNGVLEWVAHNNFSGTPKQVQQAFLKETKRLLKPNGKLYVGIENRISYKYFRGTPEGHINMMFGALLPRRVTNAYLKWRRNRVYREYTYTKWGYSELLKKAGYVKNRFFVTVPQYSNIREFIPIHRKSKAKAAHGITLNLKTFKNIFSRFPTNYFTPNVGFMGAESSDQMVTTIESVLSHLKEKHTWKHIELQRHFGKVSGTGKINTHFKADGKDYWLSIGTNHIARNGMAKIIAAHDYFNNQGSNHTIAPHIPEIIDHGAIEAYSFLVEHFVDGTSPSFSTRSDAFSSYNNELFNVLIDLAKHGQASQLEGEVYDQLIKAPMENMCRWFSSSKYDRFKTWLDRVEKWLEQSFYGKEIQLVPTHGDLVPTNTLIDKNQKLWVIDWELFSQKGLPAMDLVIFIGNSHRNLVRKEFKNEGLDPDQIAFHGYPEKFFEGDFSLWLDKYLQELNIDQSFKKPLLFMWWVTYLNLMLPLYRFNPKWKEYRVVDIIKRWEKFIDFENQ